MSSDQTEPAASCLLDDFPPVTYEDWRRLVEAELKGAPFDKKMLTATYEGITLNPLYRREDTAGLPHVGSFPGFAPFARGASASGYAGRPWDISQEIGCSSPTEFNHAARNSLSRGLNALNMVLDQATRDGHDPDWAQAGEVGHGGLSIATLGDLDRALDGIDLEKTGLFVRAGASALPFAALLIALARQRKKAPAALRGCIEMDPLGVLSHQGKLPQSLPGAYQEMASLCRWAADRAPQLQTICVHSRSWHESGGHAVQELAFSLATAVAYLRQLSQRGIEVNTTAPRLRFAVTVGVNFFTEIAKLRALRMLWSRVVEAAGGNDTAQRLSLHVRTSLWNKTIYDPYNNLLRTTVEAFAAVLGGCDSLQVGAFDEVARTPDDFSQRLARNVQLVLQKECDLERVIDPAGGCWYVEVLTAQLGREAWKLFQEIERRGGMEAALLAGFPQQAVAQSAAARFKAVAHRRDSIIGINQYVNLNESALDPRGVDTKAFYQRRSQQVASHRTSLDDAENADVLERLSRVVEPRGADPLETCIAAVSAGATLGEITRAIRINDSPCSPITPVCLSRAAAQFERLRAAMDRRVAAQSRRPKVFLCNLGSPRDYRARAEFSRGFFAPGGFEVVSPPGFATPEAAVEGFMQSQAEVAVICSTDERYPALVPPVATALRRGKSDSIIVLAGYPSDQIEAHKRAGVDEFIHVRADALEVLCRIHNRLGIE
jgi:methylmalonyl-CoA mutase